MWGRYRAWTIRQADTAQCSPAIAVAVCIVLMGITAYIYRRIILETIEIALLVAFTAATVTATVAFTLAVIRWHRRRTQAAAALGRAMDVAAMTLTTGSPAAAEETVCILDAKQLDPISQEADDMAAEAGWLAADEVDLSMDEHGNLQIRSRS